MHGSIFVIIIDFVFLLNEAVFWNPLGRKEKVDGFWLCVNKCQHTLLLLKVGAGMATSFQVLSLHAVSHCWWWRNMGGQWDPGYSSTCIKLLFSGMWREKALEDPAKGIWVLSCHVTEVHYLWAISSTLQITYHLDSSLRNVHRQF